MICSKKQLWTGCCKKPRSSIWRVEPGGFCPIFVIWSLWGPAVRKSSLHRAGPCRACSGGSTFTWLGAAAAGGESGIKNILPKPRGKQSSASHWLFPESCLDRTYCNNISCAIWAFLAAPHCCFLPQHLQVTPAPLQCPLFTSRPQIVGNSD